MNRELAVDIARDVIKRLDAREYIADAGLYVDVEDVQEERPCHVCALGAAFMSHLRLQGRLKAEGFECDVNVVLSDLSDVFGYEQIGSIEDAFEGWDDNEAFYNRFEDSADRLRAIMQNVIDNGGIFTP